MSTKIGIALAIIVLLVGGAAALPKLGANVGFSNPGDMEIGGDVSIGGSLSVGGATVTTGVISDDISMAAGKDISCASGASDFNFSLGSGVFKTTSGAVTIGGGTNGITLNGPVTSTDAGAALSVVSDGTHYLTISKMGTWT